jgi:uncharacterized membrane protein YhhN
MIDAVEAAVLAAAAGLLAALLVFERRRHETGVLATKTPLSLLFITMALLQPRPDPLFSGIMLAGFVLCLGGDVFLALSPAWTFRAGLVSFLLGHVAYIAAFATLAAPGVATLPGLAVAGLVSAVVFVWLRPHLGRMTVPVLAYVVVITAMVAMAWTVLVHEAFGSGFRALLFAGALAFYASDVFVARDRFVSRGFVNRAVGLPLYYAGQFLLALSLGVPGR